VSKHQPPTTIHHLNWVLSHRRTPNPPSFGGGCLTHHPHPVTANSKFPSVSPIHRHPRSLLNVALSVGTATSLCKVVGMAREMLLAASFGVGPVSKCSSSRPHALQLAHSTPHTSCCLASSVHHHPRQIGWLTNFRRATVSYIMHGLYAGCGRVQLCVHCARFLHGDHRWHQR